MAVVVGKQGCSSIISNSQVARIDFLASESLRSFPALRIHAYEVRKALCLTLPYLA